MFKVENFFRGIFAPKPGEPIVILYDVPHDGCDKDNDDWKERRAIAVEWQKTLANAGFTAFTAYYPATGQHNGNLPETCCMATSNTKFGIEWLLNQTNIVISMPEYSATAPLSGYLQKPATAHLRIASMPGLNRAMLETGLAADYAEIKRRCDRIQPIMQAAVLAKVEFSTGHQAIFDLRFNDAHASDGNLQQPGRCTNLPGGEDYKVPFEGNDKFRSLTAGDLPIMHHGKLHILTARNNRIVLCQTANGQPVGLEDIFGTDDPAVTNIAEFAIGVNDMATIIGETLQDEKALGFHWARGRSEHLGGTVGPEAFRKPENIVHQDYVYPVSNAEITVSKVTLMDRNGQKTVTINNGRLLI